MRPDRRTLAIAALWAAVASPGAPVGCTKPEDAPPMLDPAATVVSPAAASALPPPASSPSTVRPPALLDSGSSAAAARPSSGARGGRSPREAPAMAAEVHPLADWMRGPPTAALASGDLEAIARTFEQMAVWAPAKDYPNWASVAIDGAAAARIGHVEAVKAACRACHAQYEARYKADLSTRRL